MNLPETRSEAMKVGLNRYFTGKPCKNGHVCPRSTSWGKCTRCHADRVHARVKKPEHRPHHLVLQRRYAAKNPNRVLGDKLRQRLWDAVVRCQGVSRAGSAVRDLGCTIPQLRDYLSERFAPGMSWDNYGSWHIDHVRPLASFDLDDRPQLLIAVHYTNLQPLWAADNISKGASV